MVDKKVDDAFTCKNYNKKILHGKVMIGEMVYWIGMELQHLMNDEYFYFFFKKYAIPTFLLSKYRNEKVACKVLSMLGYDLGRKRKICQDLFLLHPYDSSCCCCGIF